MNWIKKKKWRQRKLNMKTKKPRKFLSWLLEIGDLMNYVIGIDSGGTATKVRVYRKDQTCCLEFQVGPGNCLLFKEQTVNELIQALEQVKQQLGDACDGIVIGLAGLSAAGNQSELAAQLKEKMPYSATTPIELYNDAQLAYIAKIGRTSGLLVIAGTGSVAVGYKQQWSKIGGWGPILGDKGSGYDLAVGLYRELTNTIDTNQPLNEWQQAFLDWLNVSCAEDAIRMFYESERKEIAKAARFIGEHQEQFSYCRSVLIQAGKELSHLINRWGAQNWQLQQPLPCAFNGSVIEKNPLVQETIMKYSHYVLQTTKDYPSTFAAWRLFYNEKEQTQ